MAVTVAMYNALRTSLRPPWMRRYPLARAAIVGQGGDPTSLLIWRWVSVPSSGK